ncbi:MAG: vWA domain-containing protein, partial [Thermoprotei archaeon]
MRPALNEDYSNPFYKAMASSVLENILLKNKKIPIIAVMDSAIIHYKPWTEIVFNPKINDGWKAILEQYYFSDEYKALNEVVAKDPLLSKYATIHFLNKLFEESQKIMNNINIKQVQPSPSSSRQQEDSQIQQMVEYINRNGNSAKDVVKVVVRELRSEASKIMKDIEIANGFSHLGVPVAEFLENPDEFRRIAQNDIIVNLIKIYHRLMREAPSLKRTSSPTLTVGRPLGAKRLQRYEELARILPHEMLDDDIMTYKIATKNLLVRETYGSATNYTIYIDKSGSMEEPIKYRETPYDIKTVPKISFATASALALQQALKKIDAKMTLKFFDTEVHDPITNGKEIIKTLLTIKAGGGTNISNVLEDAVKHKDDKIVIITDGIDTISEESVKKAKSNNLDITIILIKTTNNILKKNF